MRKWPIGIALSIVLACAGASANGRFPQAQIIESVPGSEGQKLFMRTTFGILSSEDAGKTWHWICEKSLGYEGQWDPPIAVTKDGRLWVGLDHGLASTVDGCLVDTASELEGNTVKDLTTDGTGEILYAITGKPGVPSAVWRRDKSGKWARLGSKTLETLNLLTIEVAPSKPSRIYVSGEPYDTIRGRLYRSDDSGQTFVGVENDEKPNGPFFIGTVDPKNADTVILRHLHANGSELLATTDAGRTFKNVLSMKSSMFGFAHSPDGQTLWAGSGLAEEGLFRSSDRGASFQHVAARGVLCLHALSGTRLFDCENSFVTGKPVIALSENGGELSTPLAGFDKVVGPLQCADAANALCQQTWFDTKSQILTPSPPPSASAKRTRDAGAEPSKPVSKGCGCGVAMRRDGGLDPGLLISGLLPLLAWVRTRRSRGSAPAHGGDARPRRGHIVARFSLVLRDFLRK